MSNALDASYAHCRKMTRSAASNFYWSFFLLPSDRRRAMYAIYAFLRHTDDLSDSNQGIEDRRVALKDWREDLESAFEGDYKHPLLPAVIDTVERYRIPTTLLFEVIQGVEMDLQRSRYETFEDLEEYCFLVASVVGMICIYIWGFSDDKALESAKKCGLAFQLTNILRDLKEDAERDRVYLPLCELELFEYSPGELKRGVCDRRFSKLINFQLVRAERFYHEGVALEQYLDPKSRRAFRMMVATYHSLLEEISRRPENIFNSRIKISPWRKLKIALKAFFSRSASDLAPLVLEGNS